MPSSTVFARAGRAGIMEVSSDGETLAGDAARPALAMTKTWEVRRLQRLEQHAACPCSCSFTVIQPLLSALRPSTEMCDPLSCLQRLWTGS